LAPSWRFWDGLPTNGCQLPIGRRPDKARDAVAAMPVNITGIGIFGCRLFCHWPWRPPQDLLARHEQLHKTLAALPSDPRYRPGYWTPRIILSQHASSVADAIRLLLPMLQEPVGGALVAVELVESASGTVISRRELPIAK
jgi:hypothetical protein